MRSGPGADLTALPPGPQSIVLGPLSKVPVRRQTEWATTPPSASRPGSEAVFGLLVRRRLEISDDRGTIGRTGHHQVHLCALDHLLRALEPLVEGCGVPDDA